MNHFLSLFPIIHTLFIKNDNTYHKYKVISTTTFNMVEQNTFVLSISGGTGSGKDHFVEKLIASGQLNSNIAVCEIPMDMFYKPLNEHEKVLANHGLFNFDHPDAIDTRGVINTIEKCLNFNNSSYSIPKYDFKTFSSNGMHTKYIPKTSKRLIIVQGIFALYDEILRSMCDLKVFLDVPADLRLSRRLKRDVRRTGKSIESMMRQYTTSTSISHYKYIEPCKDFADLVIPYHKNAPISLRVIKTVCNTF